MPDHSIEIRNTAGRGGFLLVCEHASNHVPPAYGGLGLPGAALEAHIAWDPGALGVARALSDLLDAPLVAAGVSRLVYDCNRPPDAPGAMPSRSELWEIPGNRDIPPAERLRRTESTYLPFANALGGQLARMLATGQRPVLVTVHSFTPVWHGTPRAVEFGIIHDRDPGFARALLAAAQMDGRLLARLNDPYSAADGVAHTLALHATPHGLDHAMLEIRNDLIASPAAEAEIAGWLAPLLRRARGRVCADRGDPAAGDVCDLQPQNAVAEQGSAAPGALSRTAAAEAAEAASKTAAGAGAPHAVSAAGDAPASAPGSGGAI